MRIQGADIWYDGPPYYLALGPVDIQYGTDLDGKSFDAVIAIFLSINLDTFDPGFNARTIHIDSGPNNYDMGFLAVTQWEIDASTVPIALAGLGLVVFVIRRAKRRAVLREASVTVRGSRWTLNCCGYASLP